jgi:hypothetical protein
MSGFQKVTYRSKPVSILDLHNLFKGGSLDLSPGFQRDSVWRAKDRECLIDSILNNYPLPAIFLRRRESRDGSRIVFDVIDGKQRLETIFMFMGVMRPRFDARIQMPESESEEVVSWSTLKKKGKQNNFMGYEIPVIEIDGELEDIIQLFVRINSTGKALTRQEQRHAKYYQSPFLKQAARVAKRLEHFFQENQIFTQGQLSRMKHIEFVCELMLSFMKGDLLNKKRALDGIMDRKSVDGRQIGKASRAVTSTLKRARRMFPEFRETRLSKVTDFYSLAFLIWRFEQEGMILTDKRRNELAWDLLRTFMTRVDNVRHKQKEAKGVGVGQEIYRNYHMAVSQMTDDISQRRERDRILRAVLESIFARKDGQRGFSAEQRRILWNSSTNRACTTCGCKLTWEDFTIDHIDPYSKGGRTQLDNAALMCRKHNSQKGNRGPRSKAGVRRSRKLSTN